MQTHKTHRRAIYILNILTVEFYFQTVCILCNHVKSSDDECISKHRVNTSTVVLYLCDTISININI